MTSVHNKVVEMLADIEHQRWADWQKWVHSLMGELHQAGEGTNIMAISKEYIDRWERQIKTPYSELSEKEKQSDREQVMRYLPALCNTLEAELIKSLPKKKNDDPLEDNSNDDFYEALGFNDGIDNSVAAIKKLFSEIRG